MRAKRPSGAIKKICYLFCFLFIFFVFPLLGFADEGTSTKFHYQGRLRDKDSGELVDGTRNFRMTVSDSFGTNWQQTFNGVNVHNGVFQLYFDADQDGDGEITDDLDFDNPDYVLTVEVQLPDGSWDNLGDEPIVAVPAAINSHLIDGHHWDEIVGSSYWVQENNYLYPKSLAWNIGIGTSTPGQILDLERTGETQLSINSLSGVGAGNASLVFYDDGVQTGALWVDRNESNKLKIDSVVGNALTVEGSDIGIGTTSPLSALHVLRPDNEIATIYATGNAQGSGLYFAGQSALYGGGFAYDGDGNPALVGGNYRLTFFRRNGGVDTDVFSYANNSNIVRFNEGIDIGTDRDSDSDSTGLNLHSVSAGTYTNIQLTDKAWSGSHAILFNAYKSATQDNGNLSALGNTEYANDAGVYSSGAGMVAFYGNAGEIDFYVSPQSTGQGTDINWGTPQLTIERENQVGIGTIDPTATLDINGLIRIRGGAPSAGKVLTASDVNGNASWQDGSIPSGFCLFSPTQTACPAGWARSASFDGRTIRGVASGVGGTGGSDTHAHAFSGTTSSSGSSGDFDRTYHNQGSPPHTHTFSGTTDTADSWAPYVNVLICCKN